MITVLLIDDDEDEFILFSDALYRLDKSFNCIYANSSENGLEILKKFNPQYIFVDLNMPCITGLQFIALLSRLKDRKKAPIIIYSACISKRQWENAKKAGASGYFKKTGEFGMLINNLISFFIDFNTSLLS